MGAKSCRLLMGAAVMPLVVAACAPVLPTASPTMPSPSPTAATTSVDDNDRSYLDPPSATRFTAYLEARYPDLHQAGAQLLWAADSTNRSAPATMAIPGKGRLLVEIACTDGSRVDVTAKQGAKRVFWLMTGVCSRGTLYSGEKPFADALDARQSLTAATGTKYVTAAYFIPDPIS